MKEFTVPGKKLAISKTHCYKIIHHKYNIKVYDEAPGFEFVCNWKHPVVATTRRHAVFVERFVHIEIIELIEIVDGNSF